MKFSEAFECMKQGAKVKLPSWGGFWFWDPEKKTIIMHTKDGEEMDIPHLFDRFYTTDQSRTKKTTGLGLAIAQRLVTRMGGQIVASLQNGIFAIQVVFPIVNS